MSEAALTLPAQGLVLGRYRPLRPLGSGGSGSVWLARDEGSGLDVALKIVAREGQAGARAEREVAAAARLRHERCLRAYALAHDDRHVYIAYEYVAGRTLREALREGAIDDRAAVEAAAQVLEGLAHAHGHGIVHRDVKPANVLLCDGADVSVRLLDFGLAQIEEAETLTAFGDVPGTLAYIAPERLAGEPGTPAADVWAVGVILWEALAGGHPFWKASVLESARAIQAGAPPLRSARPDLPKPLLAAVDRALSLAPAARPSAPKLAEALRRAFEERERSRAPAQRRPVAPQVERAAAGALAAVTAGWSAYALPFYPSGWFLGLAALAGAAGAFRTPLGLALALAVPVLPLGNVSLGLAIFYAVLATGWLALFAREARGGLLAVAGPLLAPLAALGLLPLIVQPVRSGVRRAAAAAMAVLLAALVAGVRGVPLPFTGDQPPLSLEIARVEAPGVAAQALWDALASNPALVVEAVALAAAAAAIPYARTRGLWAIAGFGAAFLAVTLLPARGVEAVPLVLAVWATCVLMAVPRPLEHARRLLQREEADAVAPDSTAEAEGAAGGADYQDARAKQAGPGAKPPTSRSGSASSPAGASV